MCAGALGEKASVLCLVISFDIFHLLVITLRHNDVIIKKSWHFDWTQKHKSRMARKLLNFQTIPVLDFVWLELHIGLRKLEATSSVERTEEARLRDKAYDEHKRKHWINSGTGSQHGSIGLSYNHGSQPRKSARGPINKTSPFVVTVLRRQMCDLRISS